jgi:CDP-glycerol glycerophosphotransferase
VRIFRKLKRKIEVFSLNHSWFRPIFLRVRFAVKRFKYNLSCMTHMTDKKTVVFESFWGKSYSCSPKAIYEAMLKDERFKDYQFIWSVQRINDYIYLTENPNTTVVKHNSQRYHRAFTTAKYWVYNMSIPDYMRPKKNQTYIETWHGIPMKRVGCDVIYDSDYRRSKDETKRTFKAKGAIVDYMLSPSPFYSEAITSAFALKESNNADCVVETGYPRNDRLYHYTAEEAADIRAKLKVPKDKKTILYAPTWRDTSREVGVGFTLNTELDMRRLFEILGDDYVLLFRSHHHVKQYDLIPEDVSDKVIDVTHVEDINDLYIISDMLVTDYSSTCFDYANLRRPEIFFMYDLDDYANNIRGFYFDINELPGPIVKTTEELANAILDADQNFTVDEKYQKFVDKFITFDDGEAAKRVLDLCFAPEEKEPFYMKDFLARHRVLYGLLHVGAICMRKVMWVLRKIKKFLSFLEKKAKFLYLKAKYNVMGFLRSHGKKLDDNYARLLSYKDKHKGERCFLIGNGPSLKAEDLELLKNETSFGCNMIHKIFDKTSWRPTYMCAIDKELIYHLYPRFEKDFPYPLFVNKASFNRMQYFPQELTYVQNISDDHYKVRGNMLAYYIPSKATVMSFMLELAMYMGFEEICLIGVDCTSTFTGKGHFTKSYMKEEDIKKECEKIRKRLGVPNMTVEDMGKYYFEVSVYAYKVIEQYAKKHGIKIYNCTRGGALEEFERKSLEEVLGLPAEKEVL